MLISIFTPTHNPKWLGRASASLAAQNPHVDFEWIVLLNNGAKLSEPLIPQARVFEAPPGMKNIGALKAECTRHARGEVLVELDHDDELTPDALAEVYEAFVRGDVDFAYSNCCEINADETPKVFGEAYGWVNKPFQWNGKEQRESVAFPPCPASFSRIWYGPNHLRAWCTDFYRLIGGHDPALPRLDDQDLFIRSYITGRILHIDKCLYVQHDHAENSYKGEMNKWIQEKTVELHDKYLPGLVGRWCDLNRLRKIDLCCGTRPEPGYEGVDKRLGPLRFDLDERWPFEDESVGVFRAHDAIEHLRDPIHTMKEAHRCLAPNGWFLILVPSTEGRGAFQDPTHVSFWNSNSFWYYTRCTQAQMVGLSPLFQLTRVVNFYPTPFHATHKILYVRAHLLKAEGRVPGLIE